MPTLNFSALIQNSEANAWGKNQNFIFVQSDPGPSYKISIVQDFFVTQDEQSKVHCPNRALKYLQFGILIMSLGAIEPEIQQLDRRPVSKFRTVLVKFVDPYLGHRLTKKSKILALEFFHDGLLLP